MPKTIYLQDRDVAGLTELGTLGLMSTDMLFLRHYFPKDGAVDEKRLLHARKQCQRRLRHFREHGFTDSTVLVEANGNCRPTRLPSAHRLLPAGADELEQHTGVRPPRFAQSDPPTPRTLQHRIGIVRTILAIQDACRYEGLKDASFLLEQDRYPGAKADAPQHEQFVLREAWEVGDKRVICRPDACALITFPGNMHRCAAYIEYDRSTEGRQQIKAKLPGYRMLFDSQQLLFRNQWPDPKPDFARLVFIVPTRQRRENIQLWIRGTSGAENVRLAVESDLKPETLLTGDTFQDVNGQWRTIIERGAT